MFEWLFRKSTFHRFQDSYALTSDAMFAGLLEAMRVRLEKGDVVFIIAHFPDSFTELQKQLEHLELPFSIVTESLNAEVIKRLSERLPNRVHLTLAQMLTSDSPLAKQQQPDVAMMVCERHPMPRYDKLVVDWCHQLTYPVQLGYFLSFDDPVMKSVVTDQVKMLLEQFGWGENELITSSMVSRRLDKVLKRHAAKVVDEQPASSCAEWLKINYELE